jgi:hypothetical protein
MCTVSSHHESHGVKGGEAVPHVCGGPPRARHHAPAKLLQPRQEEHDPPARDEDERQGDEPDAHIHHQHLRPPFQSLGDGVANLGSVPCSSFSRRQRCRLCCSFYIPVVSSLAHSGHFYFFITL